MSKRKYGFTLIELLVVISIIALLMSIMLPALGMVKKQARVLVCMSNLRQWGLVHQMYGDDNHNKFPGASGLSSLTESDWLHPSGGPLVPSWEVSMFKYYKDPTLLLCPSAKKKGTRPVIVGHADIRIGGTFEAWFAPDVLFPARYDPSHSDVRRDVLGSYGRNRHAGQRTWQVTGSDWIYGWHKNVAEAPMLLDAANNYGTSLPWDEVPEYDGEIWDTRYVFDSLTRFCIRRHPGWKNNCLFLDFHVRKVTLKELWRLKWYPRWPRDGYKEVYYDLPTVWNDPAHWMYNCPEE